MKKTAKICLKAFKIISIFLVLLVGFVAVRILYAPLSIPYASAFGAAMTPEGADGWHIEIGDGTVGWDWSEVRPWVRIENLIAINDEETIHLQLDEAWAAFNRSTLFGGEIKIEGLNALNGTLTIKQGGGDFSLLDDLDFSQGPKVIGPMVADLLLLDKKVSDLELTNLKLAFQNRDGQTLVRGTIPNVSRVKRGDVTSLNVTSVFVKDQTQVLARLRVNVDHDDRSAQINVDVDPVKPGAFMEGFTPSKLVNAIGSIQLPISAALNLEASVERGLEAGTLDVTGMGGDLYHPVMYPVAARVEGGRLKAFYQPESEDIVFDQISVALEGREIVGSGFVYFEDGESKPGAKANLRISRVTISDLQKYFPVTGTGETHRFVTEQMGEGLIENVHFQLDSPPSGIGPWELGSVIRTDFRFGGVNAVYTKTMPEITNAEGRGVITRETFRLAVAGAETAGIKLSPSTLYTYDIHKPGQSQSVLDIKLQADAQKLLELASNDPINIDESLNIPIERFGGTMDLDLNVRGPLRRQTKVEDLNYNISITSENAILRDLMKGEGVTDGNLDINITKELVDVKGDIQLNGVPLYISLLEDLEVADEEDALSTTLAVTGTVDGDQLLALGIPADPYIRSPMTFGATFNGHKGIFTQGKFSADVTDTSIHFPQLGWAKAISRKATIHGDLKISDTYGEIENFAFKGDRIDLTGRLRFPLSGEGESAGEIHASELDETKRLTVVINRDQGGEYTLAVDADVLDVRGILDFEAQDARNQSLATDDVIKLNIVMDADSIILANAEGMRDVSFTSKFVDVSPVDSLFKGTFLDGSFAEMRIDDKETAPRNISIVTNNAGRLMRGLGLFVHGDGGALAFEGETTGWADDFVLHGRAKGENITLLPSDLLPGGVTEGVMPGLDRIAGKQGELFENFDMPFVFERGLLDISDMAANNDSIGLTLEGQLDRQSGKINMNGVFIPAYGLNSILNKIPLIGSILGGGKKEGIIGITYRVKGDIDNPEVSVNPMSGATPGILRKIFGNGKGKVKREPEPVVAPPRGESVTPKPEGDRN